MAILPYDLIAKEGRKAGRKLRTAPVPVHRRSNFANLATALTHIPLGPSKTRACSALGDGDHRREQLDTESLQSAIACNDREAQSSETRELLRAIADRFDKTAENPEHRGLTDSWEFQTLRNGLRDYAADPVERQKRRVIASVDQLRRSLARVKTGTRWNEYLELVEKNLAAVRRSISHEPQTKLANPGPGSP